MYKAIFFDLDDTLWSFSKNAEEAFREVYHQFSFGRYFIDFNHFYSLYQEKNKELWYLYGQGKIDRNTLNSVRFHYPLERVGVYDEALVNNYSKYFFRLIPTKSNLIEGAIDVLEVSASKYPLYILSNGFKELQYEKMRNSNILQYFSGVILSDEVGVNKPDARIFNYALQKAGVINSEALMVGDNWVADIEGAKNAGIDQAFLSKKVSPNNSFIPTYQITSLMDLIDVIR